MKDKMISEGLEYFGVALSASHMSARDLAQILTTLPENAEISNVERDGDGCWRIRVVDGREGAADRRRKGWSITSPPDYPSILEQLEKEGWFEGQDDI